MLTSLVHEPIDSDLSTEDVFSSALHLISPDSTSTLHGNPGCSITYSSRRFGDIELRLAEPQTEEERKLFGQYLWNAEVLLTELIDGSNSAKTAKEGTNWDVKDERILEFGAGTGLAGIMSILSGALEVIISDYPAPGLLANVEANIKGNVPLELRRQVSGQGHQWGALTDKFSVTHGHRFTRILAADCLWISGEHLHLVQSMLHFLSHETSARVWVVACFHTGRPTVARFLDVAVDAGLEIEEIWEQDVDGHKREWVRETESTNEGSIELRKWLVVAIFRRKKFLT